MVGEILSDWDNNINNNSCSDISNIILWIQNIAKWNSMKTCMIMSISG